jgi:hypothetical protein
VTRRVFKKRAKAWAVKIIFGTGSKRERREDGGRPTK